MGSINNEKVTKFDINNEENSDIYLPDQSTWM